MSTWMVVEDEPDIYEVLLAMFEMWGIEGAAFVDGEEAIAWIDDANKSTASVELPELALLDIRLPGNISGSAVGDKLRKSPVLNNIAVVLITAYRLSPEQEKAVMLEAGADKLLYKPLPKFHELKRILEDVITERRAKAKVNTDKVATIETAKVPKVTPPLTATPATPATTDPQPEVKPSSKPVSTGGEK